MKFYNNWFLAVIRRDCYNNLHCEGPLKSFVVLLKDRAKKIGIQALTQPEIKPKLSP